MEKRKNVYSSNQIMDSSSSFTLTRANVAQLHHKSILISSLIKNTILTHQKPILLFYYIILQYTIYQMFYSFILNIKNNIYNTLK